jgi:hypothetical protein
MSQTERAVYAVLGGLAMLAFLSYGLFTFLGLTLCGYGMVEAGGAWRRRRSRVPGSN